MAGTRELVRGSRSSTLRGPNSATHQRERGSHRSTASTSCATGSSSAAPTSGAHATLPMPMRSAGTPSNRRCPRHPRAARRGPRPTGGRGSASPTRPRPCSGRSACSTSATSARPPATRTPSPTTSPSPTPATRPRAGRARVARSAGRSPTRRTRWRGSTARSATFTSRSSAGSARGPRSPGATSHRAGRAVRRRCRRPAATAFLAVIALAFAGVGTASGAPHRGTGLASTRGEGDRDGAGLQRRRTRSLDWKAQYTYIEDIGDGRGYTAGIIGFCSGTGDMLELVQRYAAAEPGNLLADVPARAARRSTAPTRTPASARPSSPPGSTAAADPVFQPAQNDERDRVYFDPAVRQAKADGLGTLGQFIYYDAIVMHGPGDDADQLRRHPQGRDEEGQDPGRRAATRPPTSTPSSTPARPR